LAQIQGKSEARTKPYFSYGEGGLAFNAEVEQTRRTCRSRSGLLAVL